MTTILGVQHKKGFIIAADSQVTADDRAYIHSSMPKIVELGDYVIAGAGNSRYCDIVLFGWEPPKYDGSEPYKFMVSQFIPELKKIHESTGYTLKDEDTFSFIVGVANRLFYVAEDYSVIATNTNVYGIGSGSSYAIGAYMATSSINTAMNVAKKLDINTGGTIQIVKKGA
jgi:ATP-dependent protease HslVU (ClpYQ) peptidase subunit